MWKSFIVGTAALAIMGASLVHAQYYGRSDGGQRWQSGGQRWQPSREDLQGFAEARLAALRAGLMLTPDQAKNWSAFEQAARDANKLRIDRRMAMRSAPPSSDPVERLARRATGMSETGTALKKLADATGPLYKSLDDNQKRRFAMLYRMGRHHWRHFSRREGDGFRRGEHSRDRG
jgi:zinc resistance-associated protein